MASKNWPSNITLETFVDIHSTETAENIKQIVDFLQNMILSLPSEQLEIIYVQEWYSGFLDGKNIGKSVTEQLRFFDRLLSQ